MSSTTPKSLISKKTVYEFVECLSKWHTLRTIQIAFDSADIECDESHDPEVSGQRRTLAWQYLVTLDLGRWPDVRRLLDAIQDVMLQLEDPTNPYDGTQGAEGDLSRLTKMLKRDGFTYEDGKIAASSDIQVDSRLSEVALNLNSDYLKQQIDTMSQSIDVNPALAIGTAKELIETTCKTILNQRGVTVSGQPDVPKLVKQTLKELKLTPDNVPDAAKGADTIRRMMSNLATVAQGLAELRNPYGSGHGKDAGTKGLGPRHARLAVGAASTLSLFLFETHEERP